jgi:hypothetical protein
VSRVPDDRNGRLERDARESEDDRTKQDIDCPRDELEPGEVIEAEIGRLVRHPRAETARLKQVAAMASTDRRRSSRSCSSPAGSFRSYSS